MNNPNKFIPESYARNNKWSNDLFKKYLTKNGYTIIEKNEDYGIDIYAFKNNKKYYFEIEVKTGYPFKDKATFPFDTVSFLGRKEKWKNKNFWYIIICNETKAFIACNSETIYKNKYKEVLTINSYERQGQDIFYRVPKDLCFFNKISTENKSFTPRPYQLEIAHKAAKQIIDNGLIVIAAEVRTGKTIMALLTAQKLQCQKILFITKKKAISSIQHDYELVSPTYNITIINYESLHKVTETGFDLVVCDESHGLSAFPKPSKRAKLVKKMCGNLPMILMTGTFHPESYSQVYHQFWVSRYSPFIQYKNFYRWADVFVNVKDKYLGYATVKDYSDAKINLITPVIQKYMITFSQDDAGFQNTINEHILYCDLKPSTYKLIKRLETDKVIEGKGDVLLADTGVKLMGKLHQMYSGTVKFESGNSMILDDSKAKFIAEKFKGKKLAIFYKFKEELNVIKQHIKVTQDLDEFNSSDISIALQIVAGREGISLKAADCIVMYNIDFSAVSYWQARDRLTYQGRPENDVYWIFSRNGIEKRVYKAVKQKKNFTLSLFNKPELVEHNPGRQVFSDVTYAAMVEAGLDMSGFNKLDDDFYERAADPEETTG